MIDLVGLTTVLLARCSRKGGNPVVTSCIQINRALDYLLGSQFRWH